MLQVPVIETLFSISDGHFDIFFLIRGLSGKF